MPSVYEVFNTLWLMTRSDQTGPHNVDNDNNNKDNKDSKDKDDENKKLPHFWMYDSSLQKCGKQIHVQTF